MSATGVAISSLHCSASVLRAVQLIELCGRTPPGTTRSAANTLLLYCPAVKLNRFWQVTSDRDRRRLRISGVWLGWLDAAPLYPGVEGHRKERTRLRRGYLSRAAHLRAFGTGLGVAGSGKAGLSLARLWRSLHRRHARPRLSARYASPSMRRGPQSSGWPTRRCRERAGDARSRVATNGTSRLANTVRISCTITSAPSRQYASPRRAPIAQRGARVTMINLERAAVVFAAPAMGASALRPCAGSAPAARCGCGGPRLHPSCLAARRP